MNTIEITSITDLEENLNGFSTSFAFRGQSSAEWGLKSSLERIVDGFKDELYFKLCDYAKLEFKKAFHLYDRENNDKPTSEFAWLSLMQHYGIPTQLIDFTTSPYTALFFALESFNINSNKNIAIYAINFTELNGILLDKLKLMNPQYDNWTLEDIYKKSDEVFNIISESFKAEKIIYFSEPFISNKRIDMQSGTFLVSNFIHNVEKELDNYAKATATKLSIDKGLYKEIFKLLRSMNINAKVIYGDLPGFAKKIKMETVYRSKLASDNSPQV